MKIALCFIISYKHILTKEHIWREWVEYNKDIINVYFFYKDKTKIKSDWINKHAIPENYIVETSYYHVVPAYISVLNYAFKSDNQNTWFCLLTDACCPIVSPKKFRYLFFNNYSKTIMKWSKPWWNINFHKRANLVRLNTELRLANDPWFIMSRENVKQVLQFVSTQIHFTKLVCDGGLANESLFAIIFKIYKDLDSNIISARTHLTDWDRMSSATSPHVFEEGNKVDTKFIQSELERNNFAVFIRKISNEFPDEILKYYIYDYNKKKDDELINTYYYSYEFIRYLFIFSFCGVIGLSILYISYLWLDKII